MTVDDGYKIALALIGETGSDYDGVLMPLVNLLMAEMFAVNNSIRACNGENVLSEIPVVVNRSDSFVYDRALISEVLPYGLAAKLIIEDNRSLYNAMNYEYCNRLEKYSRGVATVISDYYCEGE